MHLRPGDQVWAKVEGYRQGLTLVHFSAQPEPFLSLKSTETTSVSLKKCSRQAETWTSVSPWVQVVACHGAGPEGRGLHSSTFRLNFSALYGIGGARRGCVARVKGL